MKGIKFTTGRFYSKDEDQVIKAVEVGTLHHFGPCNQFIVFVDKVRMIAGVLEHEEFTQSNIMKCYDNGMYRCASSLEEAFVKDYFK